MNCWGKSLEELIYLGGDWTSLCRYKLVGICIIWCTCYSYELSQPYFLLSIFCGSPFIRIDDVRSLLCTSIHLTVFVPRNLPPLYPFRKQLLFGMAQLMMLFGLSFVFDLLCCVNRVSGFFAVCLLSMAEFLRRRII